MKKKNSIVSYSAAEIKTLKSKTDWARVRALKNTEIDLSDIPLIDKRFIAEVESHRAKPKKKQVTLLLKPDLIEWFKEQGGAYQTHIAAVLETYRDARGQMT